MLTQKVKNWGHGLKIEEEAKAKRVDGLAVKNELSRAARWQAQIDITKAEMLDRKFFGAPLTTEEPPASARQVEYNGNTAENPGSIDL